MKKNEMFEKIEKLYFNRSYSDVTTQEIADLFWINKASLYHYFKSKEQLFLELLDYSFNNFVLNLEKILKNDIDNFILDYLNYPSKTKNLFAIINQNGFCEQKEFLDNILDKQKKIFDIFYINFKSKYWFTREKTFILFSLLESFSRKKCVLWWCFVDIDSLLWEIKNLFIK